MNKYFVIDTGENMKHYAEALEKSLKSQGFHYILYLTDQPDLFCCEEVSEDDFLDHARNYKKTNNG